MVTSSRGRWAPPVHANEQLRPVGDAGAIGGRDAYDLLVKALHDCGLSDGSAD